MYKKSANKWTKHLDFFIFDILIITASYVFACLLRYDFHVPARWAALFVRGGVALLVIYFLAAAISRNYKNILQRNKWVELGKVFLQIILTFTAFVLYLYIIKEDDFSRKVYIMTAIIAFVLIWLFRVFWKHVIRIYHARTNKLPQMLIIAEHAHIKNLTYMIKAKQYDYFRVKGVVIYDHTGTVSPGEKITIVKAVTPGLAGSGETEEVPVVCAVSGLRQYLLSGVVDEVFISLDNDCAEKEIIDYCLELGITVHIGMAGTNLDFPNMMIEKLGGNTVLTTSNNVTASWKLMVKRLVDILGGIVGCFVMLILYLIVSPKIKKADPGPVFFSQERIGKNGRKFKIYKFRSMYLDAEARKAELMSQNEMQGHIFKMENDPRVLPGVGEKIRKYSIDEWPQFFNVLKGDMSLVGTRPPTSDEFAQYEPHHKARLSFKPGITGLWQISGRSSITDFEKIVELDNQYIREWSLGLDAKILLKTVGVVLKHEGAE